MILTSAAAILLAEALAWLALLATSHGFAAFHTRPRIARITGAVVAALICAWLAASFVSVATVNRAAVLAYVATHIAWIGERTGTDHARRRPD